MGNDVADDADDNEVKRAKSEQAGACFLSGSVSLTTTSIERNASIKVALGVACCRNN